MIAVFTDLDGTLLDHDTYRFDAALPAIEALRARGIPLVLASSKTEAEMEEIAAALRLETPMIVENGAGIARFGENEAAVYPRIRSLVESLPAEFAGRFTGFGDWSAAEVAEATGLSLDATVLARQRCFSEPGLWSGTEAEKQDFIAWLAEHGLTAVQGGRFFTIMPKGSKAQAMLRVIAAFHESYGKPIFSVALGDAPNDLAMIETADLGIIVANPHHDPLPVTERERKGHILRSRLAGPAGWNETILAFLARQG